MIAPVVFANGIVEKTLVSKAETHNTTAYPNIIHDSSAPIQNAITITGIPLPDTSNVITPPQFETRLTRMAKTEKKSARSIGDVAKWIADCCNTSSDKRHSVTTQEARDSYVEWCDKHSLHPLGHKKQSRQMRVILRCAVQKNAFGAIFPGLQIARQTAERRVASL
jgi:hypothetical protein